MTYFSTMLERIQSATKGETGSSVAHNISIEGARGHAFAFDLHYLINLSSRDIRHVATNMVLDNILSLLSQIQKSKTATSLLHDLADKGYRLGLLNFDHYGAAFAPSHKTIFLPVSSLQGPLWTMDSHLHCLSHMIRRAWQHSENVGAYNAGSSLDYARAFRSEEADAESLSVLIAWEMRQEGAPDFWRAFIASSDGDMALAFAETIDNDPLAEFDNSALRAAFDAWGMDFDRMAASDDRALLAQGHEYGDVVNDMRVISCGFKKPAGVVDEEDTLDNRMVLSAPKAYQ